MLKYFNGLGSLGSMGQNRCRQRQGGWRTPKKGYYKVLTQNHIRSFVSFVGSSFHLHFLFQSVEIV